MVVLPLSKPATLYESTARFIVYGNVLDGIRIFDRETLTGRDMHRKAAEYLVAGRKRGRVQQRPLEREAKRYLRIAWQTELAARVSD